MHVWSPCFLNRVLSTSDTHVSLETTGMPWPEWLQWSREWCLCYTKGGSLLWDPDAVDLRLGGGGEEGRGRNRIGLGRGGVRGSWRTRMGKGQTTVSQTALRWALQTPRQEGCSPCPVPCFPNPPITVPAFHTPAAGDFPRKVAALSP